MNAGTTIDIFWSGDVTPLATFRFSRAFYRTLAIALILGATALALAAWLRHRYRDTESYVPLPFEVTAEVELLQKYLRIDTTNPPGNELPAAEFLAAELRRAGLEPEIIVTAPGRANVYARIRGRRPGEGLLLLHHMDVVPAEPEGWKFPPFGGEIFLDQLWGRGALDMKSIGIAHLAAFTRLAKRGTPERDVVFLAVADEELGGELGTGWLVEHRPDVIEGVAWAINEGGVTETLEGEVTRFGIEVGSKLFSTHEARAARLEDLQQFRIALEPAMLPRGEERVLPQIEAYVRTLATHRMTNADVIADVPAALDAGRFWLLPDDLETLFYDQAFPGLIESDSAGGWRMVVTLSNLPDTDPHERVRWLEETARPFGVSLRTLAMMSPSPISPTGNDAWNLIAGVVKSSYGEVAIGPLVMGSITTDSRYLRQRGIDAYGFWPFPVDFFQTEGIHGDDERIRIPWFQQGVDLVDDLVRTWTERPPSR